VIEQWRAVIARAGELREDDVERMPDDVRADLMASSRAAHRA
jgi:hypothetical protein